MPFSNPSLPGRRALIAVSDGTPVSYHPPPWPSQPLVWDPVSTTSGQKLQQARAWSPVLRRSMQTTRCSSIPTQAHAHVRAHTHTHTHTAQVNYLGFLKQGGWGSRITLLYTPTAPCTKSSNGLVRVPLGSTRGHPDFAKKHVFNSTCEPCFC